LKECKAHCSDGVKPDECHLSIATAAKMTPFTDVPKSTPRTQLPGFRTLCTVSSLRVRSFVTKVALLKIILWHW